MIAWVVFRDPDVPVSPEAMELRRRVLKQAENEPATFDMRFWVWPVATILPLGCETTRCAAGWAVFLAGVPDSEVEEYGYTFKGIQVLELTEAEYMGGREDGLFYTSNADALARLRELAAAA